MPNVDLPLEHRGLTPPFGFTRHEYEVNGVRTVVHMAGEGRPLVYWHGAGSWHGFDFARPWTERFKVIVPAHPGWGESGDEPRMNSMSDYLLHYLDLFDALKLGPIDLVGFSIGGWMAAEFAVAHRERVRRLVLVAPAGLADPEHPGPSNLASGSLEDLYAYLVSDRTALEPYLPHGPQAAAVHAADIARGMQSAARLSPHGSYNPNLERWLHRATMPTLLLWSKADRLVPVGRAAKWMRLLPNARLVLYEQAGHLLLDELPQARAAVTQFLS